MRTLACVIAASTAAVSLTAAALDPAVWHLGPAIAIAAIPVVACASVQWRSTCAERVRGRHRRTATGPAAAAQIDAWHRLAGDATATRVIDVRTAVGAGVTAVAAPSSVHYWTPALDRRLLLLFDDTTSTAEIAIRMRRDRDAVEHRLVQLLVDPAADFCDEPAAPRHREPMSEAEASYLCAALDRGEPLRRMARAVGRTEVEVGRILIGRRRLTIR